VAIFKSEAFFGSTQPSTKNDWGQGFRFREYSARLLEFWWRHGHGAHKIPGVFREGESQWRLARIS
jgi:hypothetical protein